MNTITKKSIEQIILDNPDYLKKLPRVEQDIIEFYYKRRMKQSEIAQILGHTQGAVSSRMKRILKRLKFLEMTSFYDTKNIDNELCGVFEKIEIELLKIMLETTCQSETSRRLNDAFNLSGKDTMNQVKTRHRFKNCVEVLRKLKHPYYGLFSYIDDNPYLMHEVRSPQWSS